MIYIKFFKNYIKNYFIKTTCTKKFNGFFYIYKIRGNTNLNIVSKKKMPFNKIMNNINTLMDTFSFIPLDDLKYNFYVKPLSKKYINEEGDIDDLDIKFIIDNRNLIYGNNIFIKNELDSIELYETELDKNIFIHF